jgi:hypothetical protein
MRRRCVELLAAVLAGDGVVCADHVIPVMEELTFVERHAGIILSF